jgi:hypothetical protein
MKVKFFFFKGYSATRVMLSLLKGCSTTIVVIVNMPKAYRSIHKIMAKVAEKVIKC